MNLEKNNNKDKLRYSPTIAIIQIFLSTLGLGGIISIVFAILSIVEGSKVNDLAAKDNLELAQEKFKIAKKWEKCAWITIGIFSVLIVGWTLFWIYVGSVLEF